MSTSLQLPPADELALRFVDLGCDPLMVEPLVRHSRTLSPDVREHLAACAAVLQAARTGSLDASLGFPTGPAAGLDFVVLYAAILPDLREHHAALGIDPVITARTVADVGRHLAVFATRFGEPGFDKEWWIALHFSSRIFQLGRLQFERILLGDRVGTIRASGGTITGSTGFPTGLSVHIARFLGPMTAAACDASIARAHAFFAEHFPDERPQAAVCHSWLLDPQLVELLPTSNIAEFSRRFIPMGSLPISDSPPLEFTFAQPDVPLTDLPQNSSLERAVVSVLAGGGHWHTGSGWFPW